MNELTKRILVALPAAILFIFLTWLGGWYFKVSVILIGMLIIHETIYLFEISSLFPDPFFPFSIGLWVLLYPNLPYAFQIGLVILLLFIVLELRRPSDQNVRSVGSTLFAGLYAPVGLLTFILIRSMAVEEQSFMLALALLFMVWGNDIFAYFGGKSFGKHKMAPSISPKKTWEGFGFGFLGAFAGFLIAYSLIPLDLPLTLFQAIPAIVLVSIFGPAGDLAASKLKRASKVKDTSNILPGHGGFFDRFDALILAAPAFYIYLYLLRLLNYVNF